jgi:hypothetical protein
MTFAILYRVGGFGEGIFEQIVGLLWLDPRLYNDTLILTLAF